MATNAWVVPGYTQERELGRGASGHVVAAVHTGSGRRVAIKYLAAELLGDEAYLALFREEAAILRSLDVPHIVHLLDYVEAPGQGAAIVMELVDGVSLHQMITRNGPAAPESALAVLKGSLLGLAAAHSVGIVHRDYKPENVLVDREGTSKLSDFGVAARVGGQAPAAGTPLYMAPEQWQGGPPTPATDIYAATAVFFECLTGKTPFSGRVSQLRSQHLSAAVPVDQVDGPLRGLLMRGLAKNPAHRPANAAAFVADLEATAVAAYGRAWEERGRSQLAERVAALLLLLLLHGAGVPGGAGTSWAVTQLPQPSGAAGPPRNGLLRRVTRSRKAVRGTVAAGVVVMVGIAAAVALASTGQHSPPPPPAAPVAALTAHFQAQATVVPPVATSSCATPATFTYGGDVTATAAGPVSYRWVYSSGKEGPAQTLRFTAPGTQQVPSVTVKTRTGGAGWAELKVIQPADAVSNKADYRLLCKKAGSPPGQVTAAAAVSPATRTVTCGTQPPAFTFTGSITSTKAGPVTYYWAMSNGTTTAPATVTFAAPGPQAVAPLKATAPADTASGAAEIVVTHPDVASSNTATYTLTCKAAATSGRKYPSLLIATASLPGGTEGSAYSAALAATGGNGTFRWSAAGLPAGLSINSATGAVSGTPTNAGTSEATVTVTDTEGPKPQTATATFPVVVKPYPALAITTASLAGGTMGTPYSAALAATGGNGRYTWSASGLPAGLSINAGTGAISGTPAAGGTATIAVTVTDTESPLPQTATGSFTLAVKAVVGTLAITTTSLPDGIVPSTETSYEASYAATVSAAGGDGKNTWRATGLPGDLSINAKTGKISGTLTNDDYTDGTPYEITVTVTDGETPTPQTATRTFPLTVTEPATPPSITTASLPSGIVGVKYAASLSVTGEGPYTWKLVSGNPPGFRLSAAAITGATAAAGTFEVTVSVTDSESPARTATKTVSLTIYPKLAITTSTTLPAAHEGEPYSASLSATGGNGQYTWTATGLPSGLSINASTGAISGETTASTGSPVSVMITVTDTEAETQSLTETFSLSVDGE